MGNSRKALVTHTRKEVVKTSNPVDDEPKMERQLESPQQIRVVGAAGKDNKMYKINSL